MMCKSTASAPQPSSPVPPTRPAQPEPAEPVTQPAPQGKPVVFSLAPELPAQPQRTNRYCPHCGAPLEINASAKCPYCGSVITLEEHGFALNAIRAISQETRGYHQAARQLSCRAVSLPQAPLPGGLARRS